jgi:hypothetical protein
MSKFVGYGKFCWVDKDNKTAGCGDKYNNIQTTCKPAKVFVAEDSHHFKSGSKTPSPTHADIMSHGVRDPTIDYNYFRASRTQ